MKRRSCLSRSVACALDALVLALARLPRPMATWLIRLYLRIYPAVRLDEAADSDIKAYANVNAFFTRALRPGARSLDETADGLYAPADGRISQFGSIEQGQLLQAKGLSYSVAGLCTEAIEPPSAGSFITIYLAPHDYHRVHCPANATLIQAARIGGRTLPVNEEYVCAMPELYCTNRRVVCEFSGERGRVLLVMVGARNVAAISTSWDWPRGQALCRPTPSLSFAAMAEIGRFNLGSTVIVLTDYELEWSAQCRLDAPLRLGQALTVAKSG